MAEELISIGMIRPELDNIPQYSLPPGYSNQWYQPGLEKLWVDIHMAADKYRTFDLDVFAKQFGSDLLLLSQRQCYLLDTESRFIGTATAWFDDDYLGQNFGRVHWVAIIPQAQGQGLAKPLLTIILNRLCELGHTRAYLNTQTVRIPAINLYAKFGFVPHIRTPDDLQVWSSLQNKLKQPFDLHKLSKGLSNRKG